MSNQYKSVTENMLELAGVKINGKNPCDIQVHNERFYKRVITEGELGLGESYMEEWWDVEKLDDFIYKILLTKLDEKIRRNYWIQLKNFSGRVFNLQSRKKAYRNAQRHYDLGNDLFQNMLDKRMNYSCGYWKNAKNLEESQEHKLELICQKISIKPGMRILDIGCGWGAFGKYAAEKYQVEVIGITVSKQQVELGKIMCEGLPVEFKLADYRTLNEKFDAIVSVGMIEHVGYKNYNSFFKVASNCLKDSGLFLLHTIGCNSDTYHLNPWTDKYIFPNGQIPSAAQLGEAFQNHFVMEDWHNFGVDYDKTLMAWYSNFTANWDKIKSKDSTYFYRMWEFYLLSAAASFRARKNQLWQIVLSKDGIPDGYQSIR